jgi:hypothetical protein
MGRRGRKRKREPNTKPPVERTNRRGARPTAASPADRYVAELAADARADGARHFTLDRRVAKEKLRDFQLPDPDYYVLLEKAQTGKL